MRIMEIFQMSNNCFTRVMSLKNILCIKQTSFLSNLFFKKALLFILPLKQLFVKTHEKFSFLDSFSNIEWYAFLNSSKKLPRVVLALLVTFRGEIPPVYAST